MGSDMLAASHKMPFPRTEVPRQQIPTEESMTGSAMLASPAIDTCPCAPLRTATCPVPINDLSRRSQIMPFRSDARRIT